MHEFLDQSRQGTRLIKPPTRRQITQDKSVVKALSNLLIEFPPSAAGISQWPKDIADVIWEATTEGVEVCIDIPEGENIASTVKRVFYGDEYDENVLEWAAQKKCEDKAKKIFEGLIERTDYERWHEKTILRIQILIAFYLIEHEDDTLRFLGCFTRPKVGYVDAYARINLIDSTGPLLTTDSVPPTGLYLYVSSSYEQMHWCKISETKYPSLLSLVIVAYTFGESSGPHKKQNSKLAFDPKFRTNIEVFYGVIDSNKSRMRPHPHAEWDIGVTSLNLFNDGTKERFFINVEHYLDSGDLRFKRVPMKIEDDRYFVGDGIWALSPTGIVREYFEKAILREYAQITKQINI